MGQSKGKGPVTNYSMFCYPWDLLEAGVSQVADDLRARHLTGLTVAAAYHAGKFLRPHGRDGRVYFPEDGVAYFRIRAERYGDIKPAQAALLDDDDILAACCRLGTMPVTAWLVLNHNSRIGEAYPDVRVENAFGDRYVYSLCPSVPAVRAYASALCADVADAYPVAGLTLETPGFLPYQHGYHHEFALVRHNPWLNAMLGLCFCSHCRAAAAAEGIDVEALRHRVRQAVDRYLASTVDHPDDMATAYWVADIVLDPDMAAFLRWRCRVVQSLVAEIRAAVRADAFVAVIPSVARPTAGAWYEGSDLAGLAAVADHVDACFYEPGADRIASDVHDVLRRVDRPGAVRGIVRPGYPDLQNAAAVAAAVQTLTAAGVADIAFYNHGHLRPASLDWVAAALALN